MTTAAAPEATGIKTLYEIRRITRNKDERTRLLVGDLAYICFKWPGKSRRQAMVYLAILDIAYHPLSTSSP